MVNFLKKITDANFLPGKKTRGNNHYVYSSIFNSLMDKLIPIITGEKEVTVKKLKSDGFQTITQIGNSPVAVTERAGKITTKTLTNAAGGIDNFRIFLLDAEGNNIDIPENAFCLCQINLYIGNGEPVINQVVTSSAVGFFSVQILNVDTRTALDAVLEIDYFMINI